MKEGSLGVKGESSLMTITSQLLTAGRRLAAERRYFVYKRQSLMLSSEDVQVAGPKYIAVSIMWARSSKHIFHDTMVHFQKLPKYVATIVLKSD